jgi:hypothetical protein
MKPLLPAAAGTLRQRLIEDMNLRGFSAKRRADWWEAKTGG